MDLITILFTLAVVCVVFLFIFWEHDATENTELIKENVTFALEKFGKTPRPKWSEMPEVSAMLKSVTSQEKQLYELRFEVMTSEATYLKSLMVLDEVFIKSEELSSNEPGKCVLTKQQRHEIFSNTDDLRKTSERFMSDLVTCWKKSITLPDICDIITKHAANSNFSCFVDYCRNQEYQIRSLNALKQKPDFCKALAALEAHEDCETRSLASFLILPVQRIPRLEKLAEDMCTRIDKIDNERRNSDPLANESNNKHETICIKKSAVLAKNALNKVAIQSNDAIKRMQLTEEMIKLDKKIYFPPNMAKIPLISESKQMHVVKQREVTKIVNDFKKRISIGSQKPIQKIRHMILLSDVLLIVKKKGDRFKVENYCQRNKLVIEEIDNFNEYTRVLPLGVPNGCNNLFLLVMLENCEKRQVEEVYACDSANDRDSWVEDLTSLKVEENEETYASWDCPQVICTLRYFAQKSGELTLKQGDIVKVFKKHKNGMNEGQRVSDGERGWFPSNHTEEIETGYVAARRIRMKYQQM